METFNGVKKSHLHFVARKPRKSWGLGPSLTCDNAPDIVFTRSTTYIIYTSGKLNCQQKTFNVVPSYDSPASGGSWRYGQKTWYRLATKRKVVGIFNRSCMLYCPLWNQAMTHPDFESQPHLLDLSSRRAGRIRNDLLTQNTRTSSVQGKPFPLLLGAGEKRIKMLHVIDGTSSSMSKNHQRHIIISLTINPP